MRTSNRSVCPPCSKRVSATSRTAVYGPVRTVVWEGRDREAPPYPDHSHLLCTCPSGHDPRLSCPSLPSGVPPRPPSPALARLAKAGGRSPLLALRSRPTIQIVASACRRCRRCPRRTEFVSRRDLRYLLRQVRSGHNLANALDEGCGAERLFPQDH